MAMRYGVGVGKAGFGWSGRAVIQYKRKWPRWTPTDNMIARDPELEQWRDGMEPGLTNPLGARALYLFENGRDTLYRIHGTNEPWSIGQAMSSGCIRLLNQDIIDLYNRIPNGNPVLVKDSSGPPAIA
jgi:lipoprotein-anchoring transpeptidase ErfK/SrfK